MKHAIAWWCFERLLPPADLIRTATELGYGAFDLAPQDQWNAIRDAGLAIAAVGGHDSIEEGLNRREHHDRIEREITANLALAEKHGIHSLICFSGNRHQDTDEQGIDIVAEGLGRVAKAAEQAGVDLVMELLNSKVDHPGYQCDHTAWGVEVVRRVNSPRVKLLYDIYHMQIMEGDLVRTIREHHPHIAHYHTAGNPGRHDIGDDQEINYPAVVAAIRDTGYEGYLAQEFVPRGDPIEALRHALALCGG